MRVIVTGTFEMELVRTANRLSICIVLSSTTLLGGCLLNDPVDDEPSSNINPPTSSNLAPVISGTPPQVIRVGVNYSFVPEASDANADTLSFQIVNQPNWSSFNANTGQLSGVPFLGSEGMYSDIEIQVSDGQMSTQLPPFSITVESTTAENMPPEISGNAPPSVTVGNNYLFAPAASDPDGDQLTYSIVNQPSWSTFDLNSGRLTGTPQTADIGTYTGIAISISDGVLTASSPAFSITVNASNNPPSISGTPPSMAVVGQQWSFVPTASDPDGDNVTFSISNRPSWATFSQSNGSLSGTPQSGDVGVHSNIQITVSDGTNTTDLPAFSVDVSQIATGTATLSWTAPTTNNDGSPLNNLAGFRVYYGTSVGNYPNQVSISNPGLTTTVVDNLAPGTYYFVSTAISSQGVESNFSNVAQKTIN